MYSDNCRDITMIVYSSKRQQNIHTKKKQSNNRKYKKKYPIVIPTITFYSIRLIISIYFSFEIFEEDNFFNY